MQTAAVGSTRILEITTTDLPSLVALAREFFEEAKLRGSFDADWWMAQWTLFLTNGYGHILVARRDELLVGGVGYLLYPDVQTNVMTALEAFLFVSRPYRHGLTALRLLHALESDAARHEARLVRVAALEGMDARVPDWYQREGYRPVETIYEKGVGTWP